MERPLSDPEIAQMRHFNVALDTLQAEWTNRLSANAHIGNYHQKEASLQFHFAKLYLCSHVLRGVQPDPYVQRISSEALGACEFANIAIFSAESIIRAVISDEEFRSYLNGLPTYFHTMITFATVFLLKTSTRRSTYIQLDVQEVHHLLNTLVTMLEQVADNLHPRHLLVNLTKSIHEILRRIGLVQITSTAASNSPSPMVLEPSNQSHLQSDPLQADFDFLTDEIFNPATLGDYDMLSWQGW